MKSECGGNLSFWKGDLSVLKDVFLRSPSKKSGAYFFNLKFYGNEHSGNYKN
jgi:hypothetical protein